MYRLLWCRALLAMIPLALATASAQSFSGSYVMTAPGGNLSLQLQQEGSRLSGTLTLQNGERYRAEGTVAGSEATGDFVSPEGRSRFAARLEGQNVQLVIDVGGQTVQGLFNRTTTPGRGVPPPAVGGAAPPSAAAPAPAGWGAYRHPLGFVVRYPSGWQVHDQDGLALVPNDAPRNERQEPLELFVFGLDGAEGVADPGDQRVGAYFLERLPGFSATGQAVAVNSELGRAAVWTFEGQAEGNAVVQQAYVALSGSVAVYMVHASRKDLLDRRRAQAQQMFGSVSWGPPQLDGQLVRRWTRSRTESSQSGIGSLYSNTTSTYVFQQDGTVLYSSQSRLDVSAGGASGVAAGQPGVDRGRWGAADGKLFILWDNGSVATWRYSVFPHEGSVGLRLDDGKGGSPLFFTP